MNVLTLATEGRRPGGDWPRAALLVACFVPGSLVGALVLRLAPQELLELLVALSVLGAIAVRALPAGRTLRLRAVPAGALAGAFGMATGISGPPLLLHLLGRGDAPARTRDTLAGIFLATAGIGLASLVLVGAFSLPGGLGALVGATALGHLLGRAGFRRLGPQGYEHAVLATMAAGALASLVLLAV